MCRCRPFGDKVCNFTERDLVVLLGGSPACASCYVALFLSKYLIAAFATMLQSTTRIFELVVEGGLVNWGLSSLVNRVCSLACNLLLIDY